MLTRIEDRFQLSIYSTRALFYKHFWELSRDEYVKFDGEQKSIFKFGAK